MFITEDMIINGFASVVATDCTDLLKGKIKDADKSRKVNEQNIEIRIYQVIINVLNEFTNHQYKGQDILYDVTECILKGLKSNKGDKRDAVREGLKMLVPQSQVPDEVCKIFWGTFYHEICKDRNSDLYKEISILLLEQAKWDIREDKRNSHYNEEKTHEKLYFENDKKVNLFLSYCWNDTKEANRIYDYFKRSQNIELHRDRIDIGRWGSIKEYMQSISNMDYIILLISDSYLKSANCMYEVLEVMRDRYYRDKIFPAVIYSGIYDPSIRADYVQYWEEKFIKLKEKLAGLSVQNLGTLPEDLKQRQDISSNIAKFLGVVSDMNNPKFEDVCLIIEEKLSQKGFLRSSQIRDDNGLTKDSEYIKENMSSQEDGKVERNGQCFVENRGEEYANKWNKNVFLNNFDEEDEQAGVNIKLKDIYIDDCLPHYIWKTNINPSDKLKELLKKYIIDNNEKKMLLILGQPGIGKSTLITWIMANLVEKRDDIFVYQFASDLGNVNWQSNNILDNIFKSIGYGYRELEGKTLILDGFDEICVNDGRRERILNKMNQELKRMNFLRGFSLIITCRQNYVEQSQLVGSDYITLQAWNGEQIKSFCEIYEKKITKNNPESVNRRNLETKIDKILENKEVFGIPLILYMVLALRIDVEKGSSIVNIYSQIFSSKKGGIYDRGYDIDHRINSLEIKRQIHQVSQRIAFWIFENNSEKASIPQQEFKKICDNVISEVEGRNTNLQSDVLIGNYFSIIKQDERIGMDDLQFLHRSIYEYFVTEYFFESVQKLASKEEIAGKLGELLKKGQLSEQILEFIKYKFEYMKDNYLSDITREVFNIMLHDGMTYYVKDRYKNVIDREMNIFFNMLKIVHLWNSNMGEFNSRISNYLLYNHSNVLILKGIKLRALDLNGVYLLGADLSEVDLSRAKLSEANLSKTRLIKADLSEANLKRANLSEAKLSEANLKRADLSEADLTGADLISANLREAELMGADLKGAYLVESYLGEAELMGADLTNVHLLGAHLEGANLFGADLTGANLTGADLTETLFDEEQVMLLSKRYDLSNSMVYIFATRKIVNYKEYCIRMRKD